MADRADAAAAAPCTVLVWEADAVRRRAWMAVLRAAGHAVRGASREAERAKALADGVVQVVVTSEAAGPPVPAPVMLLRVAPACPPSDLVTRVAQAAAARQGHAVRDAVRDVARDVASGPP
jgi:hypothetical protein